MPVDFVVDLVAAAWDAELGAFSIQDPAYPPGLFLPNVSLVAGVQPKVTTAKCKPPAYGGSALGTGPGPCVVEYAAPPSSPAASDVTWCRYLGCTMDLFAGSTMLLQLNGLGPAATDRVRLPPPRVFCRPRTEGRVRKR